MRVRPSELVGWLDHDTVQDDLERRQARLYRRTILVLIVGCLLSLPVVAFIPAGREAQLLLGAAQLSVVMVGTVSLLLLRRGLLAQAVLTGSLGLQLALAVVIGVLGMRNAAVALFAFALPLVITGLLASRRELTITAATSVLLVTAVIVIEQSTGRETGLPGIGTFPAPLIGITFAVVLGVIGLILDRYGDALRRSVGDLEKEYERRRALEARLVASQRLESIGRLAGGVAHDFNNLLTVVIANAALAADEPRLDASQRLALEEIRTAATKAARLTRQLLAFSRRQILETRAIDLNVLLESIEGLLGRLIGDDVELRLELSPDLCPVLADDGQIEQVIVNLVVNARDAMPDGGLLLIRSAVVQLEATPGDDAVPAGDYALIEVRDSGVGMDEAVRSRVFEPFFSTKGLEQGTGLGLATSYGIVKQHGGHIDVQSTPGLGSSFRVYLPRHDGPPEPLHRPILATAQGGGDERILVVDDDAGVRSVTLSILRNLGYAAFEASNSVAARALFQADALGPIDLVLTDLVMPNGSGAELATWLRERRPGLRIIFMSGYTDSTLPRPEMRDPGIPLLRKPFTPEQLAAAVRQSLDPEAYKVI